MVAGSMPEIIQFEINCKVKYFYEKRGYFHDLRGVNETYNFGWSEFYGDVYCMVSLFDA